MPSRPVLSELLDRRGATLGFATKRAVSIEICSAPPIAPPGRQERTIWTAWEAPGRQERTNWTACKAPGKHQGDLDRLGATREAGKD